MLVHQVAEPDILDPLSQRDAEMATPPAVDQEWALPIPVDEEEIRSKILRGRAARERRP
jgi:hypothetical protein